MTVKRRKSVKAKVSNACGNSVVVNGLAWGVRGPLQQAIRADYFGATDFGKIMGFSSLIIMMGMVIGPFLAGWMAEGGE